jgi:alpha-tubulin suppressor-like RCC1 family protein
MELQYENAWAPVSVGENTASFLLCDGTYVSTNSNHTTQLVEEVGLNVSHTGILVTKAGIVSKITPPNQQPNLIIPDSKEILYAAAGKQHQIFVTYSGKLFYRTDENPDIQQISCRQQVCSAAAGDFHTVFVTNTGQVWGFGNNSSGEVNARVGNKITTPIQVTLPGIDTVHTYFVQVAAGSSHSLALTQNGKVCSWGYNNRGQLGQETNQRESHTRVPTTAFGGQHVHFIAAGGYGSCAITQTGQLFTWGNGVSGRLGVTEPQPIQKIPIQVTGELENKRVTAVATHTNATIAVTHDGDVYGWGQNSVLGIPTEGITCTPHKFPDYKCEGGP